MYRLLLNHYWQEFFSLLSPQMKKKMLPIKMSLPSLGVYYVRFYPPPIGRGFFILQVSRSMCIACYPTTIGKEFLLWIVACSPAIRQKCLHLKWVS